MNLFLGLLLVFYGKQSSKVFVSVFAGMVIFLLMFSYSFEQFGESSTLSFIIGLITGICASFGTYKYLASLILGIFGVCVGLVLATAIILMLNILDSQLIVTLYSCLGIAGFVAFWRDEFLVTTTAFTGSVATVVAFFSIIGLLFPTWDSDLRSEKGTALFYLQTVAFILLFCGVIAGLMYKGIPYQFDKIEKLRVSHKTLDEEQK